jgi:hypothetical protein
MPQHARTSRARPARLSRVMAAACYLVGAFSLVVVAVGPRNPFLVRHAQQAMILHLVRLALVSAMIVAWYGMSAPEQGSTVILFTLHLATLVLIGLPWPVGLDAEIILMLGLPLGVPWLLSIAGAMVAATGYSIDLRGMFSRRWPDWIDDREPVIGTPEYDRWIGLRGGLVGADFEETGEHYSEVERRIARELRDGRLERMWNASRVAAQERNRYEILQELELRQDTVLVRMDNLNHLLSSGMMSLSRYNRFNQDLIEYLDALRTVRAQMQSRTVTGQMLRDLPNPPDALASAPDAEAITMAVIDQTGIPVVTHGHFQIDESLISGMVSVMDGLSEEMFGSRASSTKLDDGEVVYFAQGKLSSAFITFDDEPSPMQITQLREYIDNFEQANEAVLRRTPVDPAKLEDVRVPFRFARLNVPVDVPKLSQ